MAATLMRLKGLGDIAVALILAVKPSIVYESFVTKSLHQWTGLNLSSASVAPSFNHAIACMVAAVGVGSVLASYQDRAARRPIIAMTSTWALLAGLTCVTPREWQLGSATMLMTSLNMSIYSISMLVLDSTDDGGAGRSSGVAIKKE